MGIIEQLIDNRSDQFRGILSSIEALIEALTYQGVKFKADLLMFEKAMVTLKGVLAETIRPLSLMIIFSGQPCVVFGTICSNCASTGLSFWKSGSSIDSAYAAFRTYRS